MQSDGLIGLYCIVSVAKVPWKVTSACGARMNYVVVHDQAKVTLHRAVLIGMDTGTSKVNMCSSSRLTSSQQYLHVILSRRARASAEISYNVFPLADRRPADREGRVSRTIGALFAAMPAGNDQCRLYQLAAKHIAIYTKDAARSKSL